MKIYTIRSIGLNGSDRLHRIEANSYDEAVKIVEHMVKTCVDFRIKMTHELLEVEEYDR